ncbi:MAG: hypothetical protein IJ945_03930 [Oscillospiraceae bacterium]|nr:hypothetical protein [Oscillospiraceae bacterium]
MTLTAHSQEKFTDNKKIILPVTAPGTIIMTKCGAITLKTNTDGETKKAAPARNGGAAIFFNYKPFLKKPPLSKGGGPSKMVEGFN